MSASEVPEPILSSPYEEPARGDESRASAAADGEGACILLDEVQNLADWALVEPLELRLKRRRGPPKLCVCDHALRAGWLAEYVSLGARLHASRQGAV